MDSVAVIILTKNNFNVIERCLNSFKEFNTYKNIKFYIGDTGSDKDNLNKLESYLKQFPYNKELLYFNYYNFSKNHNWIINNRVKESLILFCNDDIELKNDALSLMVEKQDNDLGTTGCKLLFPDNTIQHAGQIHIIDKKSYIWTAGHKLYKQPDQDLKNEYNVGNTFAFCLSRTSIYKELKGLNEEYIQCFEDVDYNIKCSLKGLKHLFIGNAVCIHHESVSRKKNFEHEQEVKDWVMLKMKLQQLYV
jgi:GT2 family glycosyltransferase